MYVIILSPKLFAPLPYLCPVNVINELRMQRNVKKSRILVTASGRGDVDAWNMGVGEPFSFSDPTVICMYSLSE
jgi:predicted peptidase